MTLNAAGENKFSEDIITREITDRSDRRKIISNVY
jgi:hypothetical protein